MVDYRRKIEAEFALIHSSLAVLQETVSRERQELPELMAIAGFISNIYHGCENILKLSLKSLGLRPPSDSSSSHRDLLNIAREQRLISNEVHDELNEYRAFRHFLLSPSGRVKTLAFRRRLQQYYYRIEHEPRSFGRLGATRMETGSIPFYGVAGAFRPIRARLHAKSVCHHQAPSLSSKDHWCHGVLRTNRDLQ